MTPRMARIFFRIAQTILVAVFLAQGGAKLLTLDFEVEGFARWGYPVWFMYLVGSLEIAGAVGLLSKLRPYAATGLSLLMAGAIYTHFASGEPQMSGLAIFMLLLLLASSWLKRKMNAPSAPPAAL